MFLLHLRELIRATWKTLLSCLVLGLASIANLRALSAQQSPYDMFPTAEPPYYRVRYEASTVVDQLKFAVNYTIWLPDEVKTLRGVIVHQHGCGEGSCRSGLTGAYDLHWQALAKKHSFALLSPAYEQPDQADCQLWCDPRNGSDAAFQRALQDLGEQSGHKELSTLPWALWGHSGGGHWAGGMVMLHPERVVAAWLRSGVPLLQPNPDRPSIQAHTLPQAALSVPIMCNLGTREGVTEKDEQFAGVWPANELFFNGLRRQGGLVGVAVDPLTSHECGNQRYLAIPWLDACLAARVTNNSSEPLREMPSRNAYLSGTLSDKVFPINNYPNDPLTATWLPNEVLAVAWSQYVRNTQVADTTPPPAPTALTYENGKLRWECDADLESGLAHFIIERDGKFLSRVPESANNPFGRPIFQNLQYSDTPSQPLMIMEYMDETTQADEHHEYRVIAVNTVGLTSMAAVVLNGSR